MCKWIKENNFEDLIYGITPSNEPSQDCNKMIYSNNTNDVLILPPSGPQQNLTNNCSSITKDGDKFIYNIKNYHVQAKTIINSMLPKTNVIISLITNTFYGNGGDISDFYNELIKNDNKNVILDAHRYSDWGYIPNFNPKNADDSYKKITSGYDGNIPETISTAGTWTNYSYINNNGNFYLKMNKNQPYKNNYW